MTDQSYASGPGSQPLLADTIGGLLRRAARDHGPNEALVSRSENLRWTYSEFERRVDELAAGLLRAGLRPADRIGIWAPNSSAWTLLQFAAGRAGLVFVTFNTAYQRSELEFVLRKVGCRALVLAQGYKQISYPALLETIDAPDLELRILINGPARDGYRLLQDFIRPLTAEDAHSLEEAEGRLSFDDPVNIQFTSGTTGQPKGVTLTHHNIVNNGYFVGLRMGLMAGDRLCIPVPLYHCFGMVMGNLACVSHGATMIYPAAAFDAFETLRTVEEERCTQLYGVPTMFIAELNHPKFSAFDLTSLRGGIMAGSPCPNEVMRQVMERMHMRDVTIGYGMTETSPVSVQTRINDSVDHRVETVGQVMPHLEVKIIDDEGHVVPHGAIGELCTRGYSVMRGYWDDPDGTRRVLDEAGWMHSGDLAMMDEISFVRIVGRSKDMIIRGGENISPREIEEFLYSHPDIVDVQVVGISDDKFGEEVCAWIVVREGAALDEDGVIAFCRGVIAHYKVPRYLRFVDTFPTTSSGKVQKFVIRQVMEEYLYSAREIAGR
jgi:fatty-acyl-CoA synthase